MSESDHWARNKILFSSLFGKSKLLRKSNERNWVISAFLDQRQYFKLKYNEIPKWSYRVAFSGSTGVIGYVHSKYVFSYQQQVIQILRRSFLTFNYQKNSLIPRAEGPVGVQLGGGLPIFGRHPPFLPSLWILFGGYLPIIYIIAVYMGVYGGRSKYRVYNNSPSASKRSVLVWP